MFIPTTCCLPRPVKEELAEPIKHTKPNMQCSNTKYIGFFSGLFGDTMKHISWSRITHIAILHARTATPVNGRFAI